ncbi:hypothetical protein [Hydrogenivirga sp.]
MLTKLILLGLVGAILSCSALVEERRADSCVILDDPVGKHGTLRVNCPGLSFLLLYDNTPDGRDPLILGIKGVKAERTSGESESYVKRTGDYEELSGWAYREEWNVAGSRLTGFESFVNGGTACYEEEEEAKIELLMKGKRIKLLNYYGEETDCGGT